MTDTNEPKKPAFTSIQGGRMIHAKSVTEDFNAATLQLLIESGPLAAFVIAVVDDEGHIVLGWGSGKKNPYAAPMLRDALKNRIETDVRYV